MFGFASFAGLGDEVIPRGATHLLCACVIARVLLGIQAERCVLSSIFVAAELVVVLLAIPQNMPSNRKISSDTAGRWLEIATKSCAPTKH